MNVSDSAILFNKNGICDQCISLNESIVPNWHANDDSESKLADIIDRIKKSSNGKDFDYILGIRNGFASRPFQVPANKVVTQRSPKRNPGINLAVAILSCESLVV